MPAHRLTQAVLNLVVNAGEAMREPGVISVRAETSADGRRVRLAIADEGEGMTPEVRRRAFDPFYSTTEDGLGLGLPHARKLVESMGGSIELRNIPGGGAEVEMSVPAA